MVCYRFTFFLLTIVLVKIIIFVPEIVFVLRQNFIISFSKWIDDAIMEFCPHDKDYFGAKSTILIIFNKWCPAIEK